ncbi:MAG: type IV pilus modification PilV family protein [Gemmatimonadales bacterium]
MRSSSAGFSLVEMLIALSLLSIGLLALVGTAGLVARTLADGRRRTAVAHLAAARLEMLRRTAGSAGPHCTALAGGAAGRPGPIAERWVVNGGGEARTVIDSITFPTALGDRVLVVTTVIACP